MSGTFESFGRIRRHERRAIDPSSAMEALRVGRCEPAGLLAFGNGRSYGDSCHNDAGSLIAMQRGAQIHAFDPTTGIVDADAGVTLAELIEYAAPYGFFPAVTPGTRFVTLGGAVANDVHGKNHHKRGTFGCHVESFELLRSDGKTHHCTVTQNPHLYAATIGGMGLTGVILRLRMKLIKVNSLDIEQHVTPFANLSEYFDLADAADEENEFAVAWVDQLATGRFEGRGVLITGNHADNGNFAAKRSRLPLRVPFDLPFAALNRTTLGLFNSAYFNVNKRKTSPHLANYQSFFYPLDTIEHWNRLYGPAGLYQHQCIIPFDAARSVVPAMLAASRDAGQASFLTVLKRFGHVRSPGLMSFPQPGYTLTMDFPNQGEATLRLLDRLDRMTVEAGGRINPYKDQRMSPAAFEAGFPEWRQLERLRDPAFVSDFWRRTALALGADAAAPMAQYARGHA
ncbi:FAD-binding oxidoreductase (plasmid) [Neorhizobium sp. SOG26]|uniref:FAD-binding oxidoreductase n=1 Tax=Neorhizobium sp. SOG26 TaxID=2060726 RepID=UPI000E57B8C4|nr:FAD-binding oxidoreductase [Neorhizobium sp. SOG26]AXV18180.1 FAD-binding oxidoreductase [Neorhizobium sp. SOG26]